ncbi:hypothetical protein Ndes2526B_g01065 [Nannochloris sp. 'desiccata']|nr:putative Protein HLB1 [Chlorella desiccata (nom. nud.)]
MSELQEACQLLTSSPLKPWPANVGQIVPSDQTSIPVAEEPSTTPKSPLTAKGPWSIPPHLLTIPSLREAALAAVESGTAASENPKDFQLVLQHGLNLQELVSRLGSSPTDQLSVLHSACEVYKAANDLQNGTNAMIFFNHAVALSDLARLSKPDSPGEAVEYLSTAAIKYAAAVSLDPNNPQALNNWALTLQEISSLAPPNERNALLFPAVARFRAAIRLIQADLNLTSRLCYNLGTVLYSHACHMADQLLGIGTSPSTLANTSNTSTAATTVNNQDQHHASKEKKVRSSFAHAASYIMLACVLQPGVKIYEDSVLAVQRLLPLPYIRTGLLLVAAPGTASSPEENWIPAWFALDGHTLLSIRPPPAEAGRIQGLIPRIAVEVHDVGSVNICRDPSLPRGWPIFIGIKNRLQAHQSRVHQQKEQNDNSKGDSSLRSSTTVRVGRTATGGTASRILEEDDTGGIFLIASEREDAEGWVDALRLLGMIGKSSEHGIERLQEALLTRRQRGAAGGAGGAQASSVVV